MKFVLSIVIIFLIFMIIRPFLKSDKTYEVYENENIQSFGYQVFDFNASKYQKYKYDGVIFVPRFKPIDYDNNYDVHFAFYTENSNKKLFIYYYQLELEKIPIQEQIIFKKIKNRNLYVGYTKKNYILSSKEIMKLSNNRNKFDFGVCFYTDKAENNKICKTIEIIRYLRYLDMFPIP